MHVSLFPSPVPHLIFPFSSFFFPVLLLPLLSSSSAPHYSPSPRSTPPITPPTFAPAIPSLSCSLFLLARAGGGAPDDVTCEGLVVYDPTMLKIAERGLMDGINVHMGYRADEPCWPPVMIWAAWNRGDTHGDGVYISRRLLHRVTARAAHPFWKTGIYGTVLVLVQYRSMPRAPEHAQSPRAYMPLL